MAMFSATALPLIVVITSIAPATGRMLQVNAASLVATGMLSVFPAIGGTAGAAGTVTGPER